MKTRKLLILLLLLVCMVGTALASGDFTVSEVEDAEGHEEIFRSIVAGNAVYLLSTRRHLYTLDPQTHQATPIPMRNANPEYEQIPETALDFHEISKDKTAPDWLKKDALLIDLLFWDGTTLYGINELNGTLYRVEIAKDEATLHAITRLDFFSGVERECMPSIRSGVACNGSLYLLMSLAADEGQASAYRFDMNTGMREPITGQDNTIVEIARYEDNNLLFLEVTSDSQWQITDFDTVTEARSTLWESEKLNIASESVLGLLYDSWRHRVLIQADKELLSLVSETAYEVVAYLPPIWSDCRAIKEDGLLLVVESKSIYARSTLQEKQPRKPLQIAYYNYLEDWLDEGFAKTYPDIAIEHRQVYEDEAINLLAEQVALRSDDVDIFEIPIGSAAKSAIEKGYYSSLSQSKPICEKMNEYRSFFQQVAMKGGDIAAIPRMAEQYTLAYSNYALTQLGLTASDMPSGFMELLDFLLAWDERVGNIAQQAEITPFGEGLTNEQIKTILLRMLMDQYYMLMKKDASANPQYEAELAELLDKLSFVCAEIPQAPEREPYVDTNERFQRIQVNNQPSYLFSVWGSFHPGRRSFSNSQSVSDFIPIALALPSQDIPLLLFEGSLFIINPYSSQKEQAIQWLTYFMYHLPAKDAAVFCRDAAPVESELYRTMKEHYASEIDRLENRMHTAENATKRDLEAQIQAKKELLYGIEQVKWDVSAEALEDYENIFDEYTVLWKDAYEFADSFTPTWRKYINEDMPGKEVAHAFFSVYEMVLKESR